MTHRIIPIIGATGCKSVYKNLIVLQEFNSVESFLAVLLDNKSSLVVKLKELLKRKLHLIGCILLQKKLSLKAVFKKLDGTTTGPGSFSILLGKRCSENIQNTHQVFFEPVTNPIVDGYIPEKVLKDISNDQRLLFLSIAKE